MTKTTGFLLGFLLTFVGLGSYLYFKYKPAKIVLSELELTDLKGNKVDLKAFQGKPLIVNFWATWCGPCIAEMPDFQKAQEELKGKVNIVYISEEEVSIITNTLEKRNYNGHFYKSNTSFKTLRITSWPVTYFYDKNGNLKESVLGSVGFKRLMEAF
jgi:thiol-disulfide isomerase/thioredoxin